MAEESLKPGGYEVIKEGREEVMKINFLGLPFSPSLEYDSMAMAAIMDRIIEVPEVSRIILSSDRNYQYGSDQIQLLREIANIYTFLVKQKKILSASGIDLEYFQRNPLRFSDLEYVVTSLLKSDPIGAYVEIKRLMREQKIRIKNVKNPIDIKDENSYLKILDVVQMMAFFYERYLK